MNKLNTFAVTIMTAAAISLSGCSDTQVDYIESQGKYELATIVEDGPVEERMPGDTLQMPDYPAGCEIITLMNTLYAYGVNLTFDEAYALFDTSDDDFVDSWWGNPYIEGAAYPPAMVRAALRGLEDTDYRAQNISGCTMDDIDEHTENGELVIIWYTVDGQSPRWTGWIINGYEMYANEHCAVIYDIEGDAVKLSDPTYGMTEMNYNDFESVWNECGSMAVVITRK